MAEKGKIDWDAVKERLRKADEALAETSGRSRGKELLRKRASVLAAAGEREIDSEETQAVVFKLASERFAFEASFLVEVCNAAEIVPVPCTPDFVLGIMSLRGRVVSIIDLRSFFEFSERGISDMNKLLVLSNGQMSFGVLADLVEGVRPFRQGELKKLPTLSGVREEYLVGVSPDGVTVLDAGKLLADESMIVYETENQA
ncbi:Chemotaxis protein CheW [uncultured bacterium]|nr:Chemotaxis protein CheW [uncultured bacterium]